MSRNWIEFPRIEGHTSRQAHADLPDGAFEREIGRDGFFGPAAHLYHRHAPTGWTSFDGALRPLGSYGTSDLDEGGLRRAAREECADPLARSSSWSDFDAAFD